jgi:hypothetical protein
MTIAEDRCFLEEEPFFQCCCTCVFHKPDFSHPHHDGKPFSHQKGWICDPPMGEHHMSSNWPAHSCGCELHTTKAAHERMMRPKWNWDHKWYAARDTVTFLKTAARWLTEGEFRNMWYCLGRSLHYFGVLLRPAPSDNEGESDNGKTNKETE